ncbi:MAG: hypothetical protein ACODAG_03005 [Myxococcota bacterium]
MAKNKSSEKAAEEAVTVSGPGGTPEPPSSEEPSSSPKKAKGSDEAKDESERLPEGSVRVRNRRRGAVSLSAVEGHERVKVPARGSVVLGKKHVEMLKADRRTRHLFSPGYLTTEG